jgi:hypothetical protein
MRPDKEPELTQLQILELMAARDELIAAAVYCDLLRKLGVGPGQDHSGFYDDCNFEGPQ